VVDPENEAQGIETKITDDLTQVFVIVIIHDDDYKPLRTHERIGISGGRS